MRSNAAKLNELANALRALLNACERYDENPSDLTIAVYQMAKDRARKALYGG